MIKCPRHGCDNVICGCSSLISDEEFKSAGLGVKRPMIVSFFVQGEPAAQGRPRTRVVRRGRLSYAQIYNPHSADEWKAAVSILGRRAWDQGPISGPIRLGATFFLPRPESHFKGKARVLRVNAPLWHSIKPDGDNFIKAVLDALTGIVWIDDSQVCDQRTIKIYTNDHPGCQIDIEPIEITSCLIQSDLTMDTNHM